MIKKAIHLSLILACLYAQPMHAQNIINAELNAMPLSVNPAFTGMFDGNVRVSSLYANQWASVTVPYISYGASADMPIYTDRKGNYLAAGLLLNKDVAGDGNISDFNSCISLAYHKLFKKADSNNHHRYDLAIGLQAGYSQSSIDLSELYFGNQWLNGTFVQGTGQQYHLGIGNSVNYALVNAGISLSHGGGKFSYTLGVAVDNVNDANTDVEQRASTTGILDLRYTGEAGADWAVTKRLTLRPELLYQYRATATDVIAGNEFRYNVSRDLTRVNATSVFLGGWYRSGDCTMLTAGIEYKRFRIGASYYYYIPTLNSASNGDGGFALSLRYIATGHHQKKTVPCTAF